MALNEADTRARTLYALSVSTGTVYDKMAGGKTYNRVMSGGRLWGATKVANTSFSVGVPLKIGINVARSNFPYQKYAAGHCGASFHKSHKIPSPHLGNPPPDHAQT